MKRCAYCQAPATAEDAVGIPACTKHAHEADDYFQQRTGRDPNEDPMLYCNEHLDLWRPSCERCEACSQHHYRKSVIEARSDGDLFMEITTFETHEEMFAFLEEGT